MTKTTKYRDNVQHALTELWLAYNDMLTHDKAEAFNKNEVALFNALGEQIAINWETKCSSESQ